VNRKIIQDSLNWIEDHLQTNITAQELADRAGFSIFHYYRLFRLYTGMPVMQYVLRRRLLHAIFAVKKGEKRVDAALRYGFDTYAGFYRAFVREFGCTPSDYLKSNKAKRPTDVDLTKEANMRLTHSLAREVLKHWKLENEMIEDWYYESSGQLAQQAVKVGEKLLLKRTQNEMELKSTLLFADELQHEEAAVETVIPAGDGKRFVTKDGWHYLLCRQPDGCVTAASEMYGTDRVSKARYTGEIIGQLHLMLRQIKTDVRENNLLETVGSWALPQTKTLLHLPAAFCETFLETFERLYPQLPQQVIHRNLNPSVILTTKDGWGMVDFEMAEWNIRLFDPCYAATAVLSESFEEFGEKRWKWLDIYQGILEGYDSVVNLTATEREAAPYVVLANQMVCTAWFASQPQYLEIYEINRRMTRWLAENFDRLKL